MDVCGTHRTISRREHLHDRSLDLSIAESSRLRLRLRADRRLNRLGRQRLEHRF
jgi:hypothetical protein